MDITAFGETKKLTEHLAELVFQSRHTLDSDVANLLTAALATIQCHESWLAQADEREARLMERLEKIERLVQPKERRWRVRGVVHHTPYMQEQRRLDETLTVHATTREDAEQRFVDYWNSRSEQHGDSYYSYWGDITSCSPEPGE